MRGLEGLEGTTAESKNSGTFSHSILSLMDEEAGEDGMF